MFVTSDRDGGWSTSGYYVHNNMWNDEETLGPETLYACSYKNWYVTSTQTNHAGAVKTYPNVHKDFNNLDGTRLNNFSTITSTFAGRGPRVGIYNVAYDLWLNGVGWGNGTTELMVWTENFNQRPAGSIVATYSAGGHTFDVWRLNDGDANLVSFAVRGTLYSGSLDLKAMISWAISMGYIPANPLVNQIGYGVEIVSTNGKPATFTFTDFSVTAR